MDVLQLRREQQFHAASHLAALYQACARRYMDAANLLEVSGHQLKAFRQSQYLDIDLAPLLPIFQSACERYNNEIYSPQPDPVGE